MCVLVEPKYILKTHIIEDIGILIYPDSIRALVGDALYNLGEISEC